MRIDQGYAEGGKVTPFYDPLISKVIVHADTREEAIEKSKTFLSGVEIEGLKTNIPLFNEFLIRGVSFRVLIQQPFSQNGLKNKRRKIK